MSWSNYRRLPDGHISVRDHLVMVGPNDCGKSSIIRALHLCLGVPHGQLVSSVGLRDLTDPTLPLVLTVTLDGIEDEDRAAFPDEITTAPTETLVIALEALVDAGDADQKTVRRYFPDGGHDRGPSKEQMRAIGFEFVPAARSLVRELGNSGGGAMRALLSGLDLTTDMAALRSAADGYRVALDEADALRQFRTALASELSAALPIPVLDTDVRVVSEAEVLDDPLSGVTVTVRQAGHDVPLSEQSDGIRALSVLTLLGMAQKKARIIAVDEPETHLHPGAQRSVARSLRDGVGQRVLVTHSPSVVGEMNPLDIVAFRADRQVRQLPPGAPIATYEETTRFWSHRLIEPLTARRVVVVEGASDQILVERVAALVGMNLDRLGVTVFDLTGAALFPRAYQLFGPAGFNVHLVGLVDEDARALWAKAVGVPEADLEGSGYVVCDPDLEGIYIKALGVDTVRDMLLTSPSFTKGKMLRSRGAKSLSDLTADDLGEICRKDKVPAALAIAAQISHAQASALTPLTRLLSLTG